MGPSIQLNHHSGRASCQLSWLPESCSIGGWAKVGETRMTSRLSMELGEVPS